MASTAKEWSALKLTHMAAGLEPLIPWRDKLLLLELNHCRTFDLESWQGADQMDVQAGSSRGETVTRASLVQTVGDTLPSVAKGDVRTILKAVLEEIAETLAQGENVKLRSVRSFLVRSKRERIGRNPRTLEAATIKPRRVLMFTPSPLLIAAVATRRRPSKNLDSAAID